MKKLLYSLAAVATLVFAASCAQEKLVGTDNADLVEVTFNVGMPDAVATKAISDGTKATELLFFAFDGNGKYLANVKPAEPVEVSEYQAAVTVKLIKGMTYNFVFWAQTPGKYTNLFYVGSGDDKCLTTAEAANGQQGFTLDISTVAAAMMNDDSFDAFYGRIQNYKVERAFSTEQLLLTRPFAQLNVGAYSDDIEAAQASNIETGADKMSTKYFQTDDGLGVNTTLDLLTGVAGGATVIDLAAAARPSDNLVVGTDAPYTWIAMLYLLQSAPDYYDANLAYVDAEEAKSTEASVSFLIATKQNGDPVSTDRIVYNVPLQRNYRTNILGNIFSVDGTFNILVDQNFQLIGEEPAEQHEEPYLPEYTDIAALNAAFAKSALADTPDAAKWSYKVKLLAAGETKTIVLPVTTDPVDLVFADEAFAEEEIEIAYPEDAALKPTKLTLKVDHLAGLTANLPETTITVVEGSLIDNATITSAPHTFIIEKEAEVTNLTILGGGLTVEGTVRDADVAAAGSTVVIAEGAAVEGTLTVSAGAVTVEENSTVEKLVVEGSATAEVHSQAEVGEIVADNPAVVTDENHEAIEDVVAAIKSGAALKAAFEAGGTVTVDADITDGAGLFLAAADPKEVVLDLNGHTVEFVGPAVGSAGTQTQALHLEMGSTVTIKNGTLKLGANAEGIKMFIQNYCELTLQDVVVDFTGSGYSYALSNNFGHITITGETEITVDPGKTAFDLWYGMSAVYDDGVYVTFDENFIGTVNGNIEYGAKARVNNLAGWKEKAILTIKGNGTFNGSFVAGSTGALEGANINIYSGKFSSDPSAYAVAGFTGELGSDNYWTIVEKTQIDAEVGIEGEVPATMEKDDEFVVTVTTNSDAAIQYNVTPAAAAGAVTITPGSEGAYTIKANEVDADTEVTVTFTVEETANYTDAWNEVKFTVNKYVAPVEPDASPYTFDLTSGWENAEDVTEVLSPGMNVKLEFAQGTNENNAPKYYSTGTAVRIYKDNTLTITADGKYITKLEFTYGDNTTLGKNNFSGEGWKFQNGAWFGTNQTSVVVTGTATTRIQTVKVTFGDEVGVLPEDPASSIEIDDVEVEVEGEVTIAAKTINPGTADFTLSTESDKISIDGKKITGVAEGTAEVTATVAAVEGSHKASSTTFTVTVNAKSTTTPDPEPTDYSTIETSNATLTAGTNGSTATVNGYDAIKVGTSKAGGDMTVSVPANTTKLHVHVAAWKGVNDCSVTVSSETATITTTSLNPSADDGISNNSPFTLSGDAKDFYFEISLSTTAAATIKFEASKRFVIWGVNAE